MDFSAIRCYGRLAKESYKLELASSDGLALVVTPAFISVTVTCYETQLSAIFKCV